MGNQIFLISFTVVFLAKTVLASSNSTSEPFHRFSPSFTRENFSPDFFLTTTAAPGNSMRNFDNLHSDNATGQNNQTKTVAETQPWCNEDMNFEEEIMTRIVSGNYSKHVLPDKNGTDVYVELHISDIPHISELGSFFELDLFYSEVWKDHRTAYGKLWPETKCIRNITLHLEYLKRLWTPNVCIVNTKSALIHMSPSENVYLILYPNGKLWKNVRMMVRAPCAIDLRKFPFDTQVCTLVFESYSYNSQKVRLHWLETPMTLMKTMELADFILVDSKAERWGLDYPNGHWDQLKATFTFERRYGYFILQAFLPSYMTVFVAWITFWMDPKELCTRATLAISAFLAICLQFGNVQQNQPRVSYIKAMDVWMLASILFMFGALVELAIISYVCRRDEKEQKTSADNSNGAPASTVNFSKASNQQHPRLKRKFSIGYGYRRKSHTGDYRDNVPTTTSMSTFTDWTPTDDASPLRNNGAIPYYRDNSRDSVTRLRTLLGPSAEKALKKVGQPWTAESVDKFFLFAYPPAFLIFNVVYWTSYLPHSFW